jgi:hypothetical protein
MQSMPIKFSKLLYPAIFIFMYYRPTSSSESTANCTERITFYEAHNCSDGHRIEDFMETIDLSHILTIATQYYTLTRLNTIQNLTPYIIKTHFYCLPSYD